MNLWNQVKVSVVEPTRKAWNRREERWIESNDWKWNASIWRWLKSDIVIWFGIFGDKIHLKILEKFLERIDWGSRDSWRNLGSFQNKVQRWLEYCRWQKYLYALAGGMPKDWRLEDRVNLWRDLRESNVGRCAKWMVCSGRNCRSRSKSIWDSGFSILENETLVWLDG